MNLIIFGSSGRTGQELVKQALAQGHAVTAFVREPTKITTHHPNLRIIKGDVTVPTLVEHALVDQDVVLSALGSTQGDRFPFVRKVRATLCKRWKSTA